jgi:ectoine hydroxylase-related dioxygenase (phytanoyl-CoA dioxygenase family)
VEARGGRRLANNDEDQRKWTGQEDTETMFSKQVFEQYLNLHQSCPGLAELLIQSGIGHVASELSGVSQVRLAFDQVLIKRPWANPTSLHLDAPYWSFSNRLGLSMWLPLQDTSCHGGCMVYLPGSHLETGFDTNERGAIGISVGDVFLQYPGLVRSAAIAAPVSAGSAIFHNGLCIHGATANMTPIARWAIVCGFMPVGSRFNGRQSLLSHDYFLNLEIGDVLDSDDEMPLLR